MRKTQQVKYIHASTPDEVETLVNEFLLTNANQGWQVNGGIDVFDKPDVTEDRVWLQALYRWAQLDAQGNITDQNA